MLVAAGPVRPPENRVSCNNAPPALIAAPPVDSVAPKSMVDGSKPRLRRLYTPCRISPSSSGGSSAKGSSRMCFGSTVPGLTVMALFRPLRVLSRVADPPAARGACCCVGSGKPYRSCKNSLASSLVGRAIIRAFCDSRTLCSAMYRARWLAPPRRVEGPGPAYGRPVFDEPTSSGSPRNSTSDNASAFARRSCSARARTPSTISSLSGPTAPPASSCRMDLRSCNACRSTLPTSRAMAYPSMSGTL
mmetsp:Transcript_28724/g.93822  ORF Transcript_28724/g.93822 Transcript_28724/m.93822 type:complete len:247 (-) Transcript_28724:10-750(-)